jgi:hypothetical protein
MKEDSKLSLVRLFGNDNAIPSLEDLLIKEGAVTEYDCNTGKVDIYSLDKVKVFTIQQSLFLS